MFRVRVVRDVRAKLCASHPLRLALAPDPCPAPPPRLGPGGVSWCLVVSRVSWCLVVSRVSWCLVSHGVSWAPVVSRGVSTSLNLFITRRVVVQVFKHVGLG